MFGTMFGDQRSVTVTCEGSESRTKVGETPLPHGIQSVTIYSNKSIVNRMGVRRQY